MNIGCDKQLIYEHIEAPLLGEFNSRNLAMACVACYENHWKINPDDLKQFHGVKRRQTLLLEEKNLILYEDFGHHATAIQATLEALKAAYPEHRLVAVFEPACNTSASHYFEKQAINAAMVYGILLDNEEYLKNGGYICDGNRTIRHESAFQNYLEKYFAFRKAYCKLHLIFRPGVELFVNLLYPFRKILLKFDHIGIIHNVNSVLTMKSYAVPEVIYE